MSTLAWIVSSGMLMSAIALIGSVTLFLKEATPQLTYLILIGDGLPNFLGGLAIAGTFRPGHSKRRRVAGRAEPGRRVGGAVETGAPSRRLRISTGMVHDALQIQMPAVRLGR